MNIIGLCGYGFSGKDTACEYFGRVWPNVVRFAFADPLKACLIACADFLKKHGHDPVRDKTKFRPLAVTWGTHVARMFQDDIWVKELFSQIDKYVATNQEACVVITDVRNINEVDAIAKRGGFVIRVHRNGIEAANETELFSIAEIDSCYPNLPIIENNSSFENLGGYMLTIAKQWKENMPGEWMAYSSTHKYIWRHLRQRASFKW